MINKTYLLNVNNLDLKDTYTDYKQTKLDITEWKIYDPSDKFIDDNTSIICNKLCTDDTIRRWITHCSLWEHAVENKLDKIIVIEEKTIPERNFNKKLIEYFKEVPNDCDILLLGCAGTCETNSLTSNTLTFMYGDNKFKSKHIFRPSYPIGLYAYVLTYKGAKKLVSYFSKIKIKTNLDNAFAEFSNNNKKFNVYACNPPLIYKSLENIVNNTLNVHEILSDNNYLTSKKYNYRPLDIYITNFSILIIVLAFIIGYFTKNYYFIIILLSLLILEITFMDSNQHKLKSLVLEFVLAVLSFLLAKKITK